MSHRFRVLDDLELELRRAVEQPRSHARLARRRGSRLLLVTAAVLLLLGTAAVALAASGVILTGAAVPASRLASPSAGAGLPQPGKWKLLSLRVPDPAGGPPWGMRLVQTTRGLVCVQLGRVQEGVLGELGIGWCLQRRPPLPPGRPRCPAHLHRRCRRRRHAQRTRQLRDRLRRRDRPRAGVGKRRRGRSVGGGRERRLRRSRQPGRGAVGHQAGPRARRSPAAPGVRDPRPARGERHLPLRRLAAHRARRPGQRGVPDRAPGQLRDPAGRTRRGAAEPTRPEKVRERSDRSSRSPTTTTVTSAKTARTRKPAAARTSPTRARRRTSTRRICT